MPRKIDLPRVASMVFNTPLMMDRGRLDTALAVVGHRILDGLEIDASAVPDSDVRERHAFSGGARRYYSSGGYLADNGIAVLPIIGTLARRASWLDAACGFSSYASITDAITEMMSDPNVLGVMLEMDSPGGEAGGVFDLSEFIVRASESTGKPVWAHANELAASAGYAIASAAEQIWLSQTAEVGSIGVVAAHVDVSKADEKAGIKWTYIHAGEKKVDGNPHQPLTDAAREEVQEDVDALNDAFIELVALNRGVDAAKVRDTQAGIFRGAKALEVGLADELGTFDEAMQAFASYVDELQTSGGSSASLAQVRSQLMATGTRGTRGATSPKTEAETAKPDTEEGKDKPASEGGKEGEDEEEGEEAGKDKPAASIPDAATAAAAQAAAAVNPETARCAELAGIAKQAARMGVDFDLSAAIANGTKADAARAAVMNKAAETDEANRTVAAAAPAERKQVVTKEATRATWKRALKRR